MRRALSLLVLGISLAASGVTAQDAVFWKSVGNWDVSIDPTIGNGCYALVSWDGGTTLRIGRNPEVQNFYLLIGNKKWSSLRADKSYEISIRFGNRSPWEVSANGFQFNPGEMVYLHAQSTKMGFIREFQRALNMRISYDGNEIDNLKLVGSRKAWDAVEQCQREVAARGTGNLDDPFAGSGSPNTSGSGRKKEDPFAD
ncbi:MAG: hypothetical protein GY717_17915 [Rhodobacteraceae bacterium]|nr:hypothetical protein [Paracoccaceae bacterium]